MIICLSAPDRIQYHRSCKINQNFTASLSHPFRMMYTDFFLCVNTSHQDSMKSVPLRDLSFFCGRGIFTVYHNLKKPFEKCVSDNLSSHNLTSSHVIFWHLCSVILSMKFTKLITKLEILCGTPSSSCWTTVRVSAVEVRHVLICLAAALLRSFTSTVEFCRHF